MVRTRVDGNLALRSGADSFQRQTDKEYSDLLERWIKKVESERLYRELPGHLSQGGFSLASGLRESNVACLEWSQVDLIRSVAWIYADQAKGWRDISVPLNAEAAMVLGQQIGQHNRFVFPYKAIR